MISRAHTPGESPRPRETPVVRRRRILVVPLVIALALAGSALAYFTSTGSGSGRAHAATTQPVTITAASGNTQALLPTGAPTGDVVATIANPNPAPVHITSLSLDTSQGTAGFANASGCALTFATQTNGGSGWTIPASGHPGNPVTVDLTGSVTMGTSAASSCQGQTFGVYLKSP